MLTKWIRELSPRAEFLVIWIVCFGYITATSLLMLVWRPPIVRLGTSRIATGLAMELAVLLLFALILRIREWTPRRLGLRSTLAGVLGGIPLCVVYLITYAIIATIAMRFVSIGAFRMSVDAPAWLMLVFIVVNSFYEEVTVTGYVIGALEGEGAAFAITASTLIRFTYHVYQGPIAALSILPLGLMFGAVYWRTRTLAPLIVAHTLTNLFSFFGQT